MRKNEQKRSWSHVMQKESSGAGAKLIKNEDLRMFSRSSVIFTTAPQPWY